MFYEPTTNAHGLPHDPYKSCVIPRPIGWISSVSSAGIVNLAPFSFYTGVSLAPPMVMFTTVGRGPAGQKDSRRNCEETGEFVVNMATWALREQVNATSAPYPPNVDEMEAAGLTAAPSQMVGAPRVGESPINLECKYVQTVELVAETGALPSAMIIGEVVGVHIDEAVLTDGIIDITKLKPLARLGYMDYCVIEKSFAMARPSL